MVRFNQLIGKNLWYNIKKLKKGKNMKKRFSIVAISFAILVSGCAQKKVSKLGVDNNSISQQAPIYSTPNSSTNIDSIDNGYQDVDLYSSNSNVNSYVDDSSYGDTSGELKNIYFDFDQYVITPDKLPTVIYDARILSGVVKNGSRVKIEGHCDARGTDEYNYALGLRRAKATKDAIVNQGVNPSSITIVSMGESSPACTTDYSEACFAKNRRVEFKVIR